jgi:AAA domain
LKGWLFLATPGAAAGKLMVLDAHGRPVIDTLATKLADTIKARRIDIVSLDPFVKSHAIEENSNSMIDKVVQVLSDLANQYNIAVDVPHHTAKGPADPGNADRGRGASAMKDAGRLIYTLTPMSPEEGQALGLSETDRRRLIRLDSAKVNILPPMAEARWFKLVGVDIGNGSELYPNGDQVQTVEVWTPPDVFAGLSNLLINQILTIIDAGLPDQTLYSDAPNAKAGAAWRVIADHCPGGKPERVCRDIIKRWLKSGLLKHEDYYSKKRRETVIGLRVDAAKRPT